MDSCQLTFLPVHYQASSSPLREECIECSDEKIAEYVKRLFDTYESKGLLQLVYLASGKCRRMRMALRSERFRRGWVSAFEKQYFGEQIATKTVKEETTMASKKALQVFGYEGKELRVFLGDDGEPRIVALDLAKILGYKNTNDLTRLLDEDEQDTQKVRALDGKMREMSVVTEAGFYKAIMNRNTTEGMTEEVKQFIRGFKRWAAHDVFPTIRKTGEYATPAAKAMKADKSDELARKRVEIMDKNADWRMAKLILEGMNAFGDVMTPESKTVFMAKYGELVAKHDFTDILPKPEGKWYSATDIASEHGTNKARIGRISNDHDLKAPEGESNEYGTWIRTKSKYSDKEVMGWVYSEKGREWFTNFFAQPAPTGTEGK